MTIYKNMHAQIKNILENLQQQNVLVLKTELPAYVVEPPRDLAHGDLATNVAMTLSKAAGKPPRLLAELLKPELEQLTGVLAVEVAGPGFINIKLKPQIWHDEIRNILQLGQAYGACDYGRKQRINVEFVSANPTGPMHAGHVRGAVIGDALCRLMAKAGYDVTREYYFNDAGAQVDVLARTAHLRYREALGEDIGAIPQGLYPGEYLIEVGQALVREFGPKWQDKPEEEWLLPIRQFAVDYMMVMIKNDLDLIGIKHDVFSNERELIENGTLDHVFRLLEDKGLIYTGTLPPPKGKVMEDWEPVPLTLFRSSQFGDSTDRPLKKRDGTWAYIMPDIAYHYDKVQRGFSYMINILGTDHGGYADRLRPAIAAYSDGKARLEVIYNNIVKVFKNGEPVKLSKRSGNLITLREMVEQVGSGAVRFFMLTRAPESELEFDFAKVIEQTRDNPVFYVQYAHARCCSILRNATSVIPAISDLSAQGLAAVDLTPLHTPEELDLIRGLSNWPRIIEQAAQACEPHRVAFFLMDLAAQFHSLWNKGNDNAMLRFIVPENQALTVARLALIRATQIVLASGLILLGCQPLEELRNERQDAA